MYENLTKLGLSCTLILDSAMGYVMEQVDMVMVGAEGVAESGGVINKVYYNFFNWSALNDITIFNLHWYWFIGWHIYNGNVC